MTSPDPGNLDPSREASLGEAFSETVFHVGGLVVRVGANGTIVEGHGDLTVITQGNVTAHGARVVAHTRGGNVILKEPDKQSSPGADDDLSAPDAASPSLDPAAALISAGLVQINKLSPYLGDLPDTALGELLVSPKDTAQIFGRDLGTWYEDTADIRKIDEDHGLHFQGRIVQGMRVLSRANNNESYEKSWAGFVRAAWSDAVKSGRGLTTGLALGTREIVQGGGYGGKNNIVANNLYSRAGEINAALEQQGGQKIETERGSGDILWQLTSTEFPGMGHVVHTADFTNGDLVPFSKNVLQGASRPVALHILPPSLEG